MTALVALAQECQITIILVVHLRRTNEDKNHEEGGQVRLSHIRGSQAVAQLSYTVIAAERDQQGKNKNITRLRILKCRETGETGIACYLEYNPVTGRLKEVQAPKEEEEEVEEFC